MKLGNWWWSISIYIEGVEKKTESSKAIIATLIFHLKWLLGRIFGNIYSIFYSLDFQIVNLLFSVQSINNFLGFKDFRKRIWAIVVSSLRNVILSTLFYLSDNNSQYLSNIHINVDGRL